MLFGRPVRASKKYILGAGEKGLRPFSPAPTNINNDFAKFVANFQMSYSSKKNKK